MLKLNVRIMFDDAGRDIYIVNGKYLTLDMFLQYKKLYSLYANKSNLLQFDKKTMIDEMYDSVLSDINNKLDTYGTKVGVFFFINDKIYSEIKLVEGFDNNLKLFDAELCPVVFFEELSYKLNLDIELCDHRSHPRGYVMYDNELSCFKVFVDPFIVDKKEYMDLVFKEFNIENKVNLLYADNEYASR